MTRILSAALIAALSVPLVIGTAPAAIGAETADQPRLVTVKSDRGGHSARALEIFAKLRAEQRD